MLTEDGGNPDTDPGLDRTYELLEETIWDFYEKDQERDEVPEE